MDTYIKGQNCRAPHLNEEVLRNELFQQKVVEELGCTGGSAELVGKILKYNATLKAKHLSEWPVTTPPTIPQAFIWIEATAMGVAARTPPRTAPISVAAVPHQCPLEVGSQATPVYMC